MHCIKVVFSCLENSFIPKKFPAKNIVKLNAFVQRSVKVKLHSSVCNMEEENIFKPPENLNGMKVLNKDAFKKTVTVPCLIVENHIVTDIQSLLKNYMLRITGLKRVYQVDEKRRRVLLNPNLIKEWNDFGEDLGDKLKELNVTKDNFLQESLELSYDNWNPATLFKAILPKDEPTFQSFSMIGHIAHLNLKNHLLDYKHVIAEILMDKFSVIKTVVCKTSAINNVYRNFEMELLRGEPNYIVKVKENFANFELDFSKVYWNPRLSTEHSRIINTITARDVMFDVFAGVGPFSIPAAKKMCTVFANDLNPDSVKWLKHNITLNKKAKDYIEVFNKDGGDFILTDVKENLIKIWKNKHFNEAIHIVMNLPALAPTFVKNFKGLITNDDLSGLDLEKVKEFLPTVHCYLFVLKESDAKMKFEEDSGIVLDNFEHSLRSVRAVSNNKEMFVMTFKLTVDYLLADSREIETGEPLPKRFCAS